MSLDERRQGLRDEFIEARGFWNESLGQLLELDPDFFAAYAELSGVPWRQGPLDPKVKQLILLAMDAAATHLYAARLPRAHRGTRSRSEPRRRSSWRCSSSRARSASTRATPACRSSWRSSRRPVSLPSRELSERQERIKADFERHRGYWNSFWDDVLVLDPDFFEAYTQFSSVPWKSGPLEPKVKELIYTAFDVAATHMFEPGLRVAHPQRARATGRRGRRSWRSSSS